MMILKITGWLNESFNIRYHKIDTMFSFNFFVDKSKKNKMVNITTFKHNRQNYFFSNNIITYAVIGKRFMVLCQLC